jgi:CRISPR system Cascade subunit CasD
MRDFLLFRIHAPLASWGDIAVGGHRPSYDHPSKSAVLGLLGAALGLTRKDVDKHQNLAKSLNFAVVVDVPGAFMRDFHTAQIPNERAINYYGSRFITRRDEFDVPCDMIESVLSSREYYCSAVYTIAIWFKNGCTSLYSLDQLKSAMEKPKFTLYAGRKACVLSLPLEPQIITCETLKKAIDCVEFKSNIFLKLILVDEHPSLYFEGNQSDIGEFDFIQEISRRDMPVSREDGQRWQFANRSEYKVFL